eukprot:14828880-Ditylum_brightwellii.AAC.1
MYAIRIVLLVFAVSLIETLPLAQLQHDLTLLVNTVMVRKHGEFVHPPTGSNTESTGNDISWDDPGFEQNSVSLATLNV